MIRRKVCNSHIYSGNGNNCCAPLLDLLREQKSPFKLFFKYKSGRNWKNKRLSLCSGVQGDLCLHVTNLEGIKWEPVGKNRMSLTLFGAIANWKTKKTAVIPNKKLLVLRQQSSVKQAVHCFESLHCSFYARAARKKATLFGNKLELDQLLSIIEMQSFGYILQSIYTGGRDHLPTCLGGRQACRRIGCCRN